MKDQVDSFVKRCQKQTLSLLSKNEYMYDAESLISEVYKQPCLWKTSCSSYNNKDAKKEAWEEVQGALYSNYHELPADEQMRVGYEVQKKWRNIKDSFLKEVKRQRKTTSGMYVQKRRPYRYFDHLQFLMENEEYRGTSEVSFKTEPSETTEEVIPTKKRLVEKTENDPLIVSSEDTYDIPKINPDVAFFISLIPVVQTLNETEKLNFQMKVLKALKRAKRTKMQNCNTATLSSPSVEPQLSPASSLEISDLDSLSSHEEDFKS